ncbi:MAG: Gfo/Idh/MocA family oxidoreductase [Kiritimatiellae bacterium]|nr:Gfo/Idh/MocA family oxidoreductase [Verrucomicrobiota bacterium]MBU4292232.1 Gfo/Idh/MocA family oxidoreductase [Verrucomicrobiota bacterium]MCG2679129.1 Gfo/Idh/MocA family oxidoreductase [Kiritimatiellia bacterium]
MKKIKIGVIGCGNISNAYFNACKKFPILDLAVCSDLDLERARAKADEHGIPRACTTKELLADPEIQIVVNLTVPKAHAEVDLAVLQAGKSVHSEKPLALNRADGAAVLQTASACKLRVGCAPDTFLGGGIQTCVKLINDGWIGRPVAATAFMLCHGHEGWHPAPEFYYQHGGGPMLDMGPYYLTALVALMGPIRRVTAMTRITFPQRLISSQPKAGTWIDVEIPTHVAGVMEFVNGAIGTLVTSFDVWGGVVPRIEVYGTEGSLSVPDPNCFGGPIRILRTGANEWSELPLTHGYSENSRGIGVADMAYALRSGRDHRASGQMALHVLDAMQSFQEASDQGRHVDLKIPCERPAPLPLGLMPGHLDE